MTICETYIGDLEDPDFSWEGGDWNGNTPRAISPFFPPQSAHYNGNFHSWVAANAIKCKQTDYGGWVAKVSKSQILGFIDAAYGEGRELPWVKARLPEVEAFVEELDEKKIYALVATEF